MLECRSEDGEINADSDIPVWNALEAELERRFETDAERREAGEAIQSEYERLVEAD